MKKHISIIQYCLGALLLAGTFHACKKMDEYKKFGDGGEISYPATFDSLKVIPGKNRVMITGLLKGDPKVTKYRIFWNSGTDSMEAPFTRSGGVDTLKQIIAGLPEGPMTFFLRTYDAKGNRSIPMSITGIVYGDYFQASVNDRGNRAVLSTAFNLDGSAVINWANVDAVVGVLGMQIYYTDAKNVARDTIVSSKLTDQQTIIPNVGIKQAMSYRTLYLPDTVGIDTFTIAPRALSLFSQVVLPNSEQPIASVANDGSRWATLRDWVTNDAAKNHNGYGGTSIDTKKIYFEAGWGARSIENGKIHQVATLPPGKYKFEGSIDWWHQSSRSDVYLVAAPGANGLPNVDQLGTAIGSKKVEGGWYVTLNFELTQQTTLSLGCLLYMSDAGEAMRFNNIRLYIEQ